MSEPVTPETLVCAPPGWPRSEIRLGLGAADECLDALASDPGRSFVVVDEPAVSGAGAHPRLRKFLDARPKDRVLRLGGGEAEKRFAVLERILGALAEASIDREGRLVVLGGGAVGDVAGLAASLWLRGIELWQVPTTLLSMVDSSVGGKTAIDVPAGKNLVGSFWPARRVFVDPRFLATLPDSELRSGLGEVLKIAIGLDLELFDVCERRLDAMLARDTAALTLAIGHCLRRKIEVVESDPTERGRRRLLNLGHTLAHAIEAESGYRVPHGLAVLEGLAHALAVARRHGETSERDESRAIALIDRVGRGDSRLAKARAEHWIRRDKKCADGRLQAVLPTGLGASKTVAMSIEDFLAPLVELPGA